MWKRQDSLRCMTAALAAFGLTLGLFWTSPTHADRKTPMPEILTPTFRTGGCEITATVGASESVLDAKGSQVFVSAGKLPPVSVVIHNMSDQPAHAVFNVSFSQFRLDMMRVSRVLPPPRENSQVQIQQAAEPAVTPRGTYDIALAPHETKSIDISDDTLSIAGSDPVLLVLSDATGRQSLTMLNFAVKPPADTTNVAANSALTR